MNPIHRPFVRKSLCVALLSSAATLAAAATGLADAANESQVPVDGADLYVRELGTGRPIIILHGGPDFDHRYLLPEMDRLADSYRLIYYDQRGRGRSAAHGRASDVSLASDLADLDAIRKHFHLDKVILLGHSWGTVLALEYALRHPGHVSELVLMNPAPGSTADLAPFRAAYAKALGPDFQRQKELLASAAYREGDPDAVLARYRLHFKPALKRSADYEKLMARMGEAFKAQGKQGIIEARTAEERLMRDTWNRPDYSLLPRLRDVETPILVIWGDHDFFPALVAEHIAHAARRGELAVLKDCGHFAFLECPQEVRWHIDRFLGQSPAH